MLRELKLIHPKGKRPELVYKLDCLSFSKHPIAVKSFSPDPVNLLNCLLDSSISLVPSHRMKGLFYSEEHALETFSQFDFYEAFISHRKGLEWDPIFMDFRAGADFIFLSVMD